MSLESLTQSGVFYLFASCLFRMISVSLLYLWQPQEKYEPWVRALTNVGSFVDMGIALFLLYFGFTANIPKTVSFGDILGINSEIIFYTDTLSLGALASCVFIMGLIGRFSVLYLHKDKNYLKFFFLYYVFQFAIYLLILSDNFAPYFIGWELLGLSSVMLISFYEKRIAVVKNSLRVLLFYKISDVFLFVSFALAYSFTHHELFSEFFALPLDKASLYVLFFSLACMIKIGAFPIVWLPRAMEGPTPSSAVFYGSLATHIPLLMFIRLWSHTPVQVWVFYTFLSFLVLMTCVTTLLSRVQSDAKNSMAYATVKNLCLIALEVILGFTSLAYAHLLVHSLYRLALLLKTPSIIKDYQMMENLRGHKAGEFGKIYNRLLPLSFRKYSYRFVLKEFRVFDYMLRHFDFLIGIGEKLNKKKMTLVLFFNFILFGILVLAEWINLDEIHTILFLLGPSWVLSLIVLYYPKHDYRYLGLLILSVMSLGLVIFYTDLWISFNFFYEALVATVFLFFTLMYVLKNQAHKFKSLNPKIEVVIFVLTLWIVGVPGFGTYYIFEKSIHISLVKDMYLAIGAFIILSINTIAVVKHFSLNILNQNGILKGVHNEAL